MYRSWPNSFGGSSAIGTTWCDDDVDGALYDCDQQYVNIRRTDYFVNTFGRFVACHETGHAVGLTHPLGASPSYPNTTVDFECLAVNVDEDTHFGLGPLNRSNINSVY